MAINIKDYVERLKEKPDELELAGEEYQHSLFVEYASNGGSFPEIRAQLLREYRAGDSLTGPKGLRRKLAAIDLAYFGRAYLSRYFVTKAPAFHQELDEIWCSGVMKGMNPATDAARISRKQGCRKAIAAPRGHAKSTSFTFKDTMHSALYGYKHYTIILSDSTEQAEGFLGDIKTELEENPYIREDFGDLIGKVWKSSVILLSTDIKVEAIGSGKKIRGRRHRHWRPDLLVLDDVENDENVNTPEQRRKLANWFNKAVSQCGDTYTDIVYIGTLLHYDSLLAKVMNNSAYDSVKYRGVISFAKNQSLWDAWEAIYNDLSNPTHKEDGRVFYEANEAEMLDGTKVLWEAKNSYYKLMCDRLSLGEASFNSEIQNDPIDPDTCAFNEEWFDWYQDGEVDFSDPKFLLFGAVDPSLGKAKTRDGDPSAIIALAKDMYTGYMYVLEASVERRKPDQIITDILEMSKRMKLDYKKPFYQFGVEVVQFQAFFKDVLMEIGVSRGEYLPIVEISSLQNKDLRINSLQPFVKNKYIKFSDKHKALLQQMREYPMGKHDDAPDTLEMVVRLALKVGEGRNKVSYKSVLARKLGFGRGAY